MNSGFVQTRPLSLSPIKVFEDALQGFKKACKFDQFKSRLKYPSNHQAANEHLMLMLGDYLSNLPMFLGMPKPNSFHKVLDVSHEDERNIPSPWACSNN